MESPLSEFGTPKSENTPAASSGSEPVFPPILNLEEFKQAKDMREAIQASESGQNEAKLPGGYTPISTRDNEAQEPVSFEGINFRAPEAEEIQQQEEESKEKITGWKKLKKVLSKFRVFRWLFREKNPEVNKQEELIEDIDDIHEQRAA